jgi:hypothetical protein
MTHETSREPELVIAVFYAGNPLMHQVSTWAATWPQYDFALSFGEGPVETCAAFRQASVSIIDATENPGRAMDAFLRATVELEAVSIIVYTESMHEGLELFVRSRGAMLLLGPMPDAQWKELFDDMERSIRRRAGGPIAADRSEQGDSVEGIGAPRESRLPASRHNPFRKIA